jgi:Cap4 dsDNA endonuclease
MVPDAFTEILQIVNDKDLSETGGGHNQKGVEFQRNWALVRMFELESQEQPDFLVLFEAIQDVAVVDSNSAPTKIEIYQVKKKDRNEWTWAELTNLHTPKLGKPTKKPKPLKGVFSSPMGKLYRALRAFKELTGTARFISNAGCDLAMADGTNAATSLPVAMANLPDHLRSLLAESFKSIHAQGEPSPDLSKIYVERVNVPVDDCATFTVGVAHSFLLARSAPHAGQARALVETLLAKVGPLGAKTVSCHVRRDESSTRLRSIGFRCGACQPSEHSRPSSASRHMAFEARFRRNGTYGNYRHSGRSSVDISSPSHGRQFAGGQRCREGL